MTEEQAIRQTVTDYYESWFDGDAPRMERALHPGLAKRDEVRGVGGQVGAVEPVTYCGLQIRVVRDAHPSHPFTIELVLLVH